MTRGTWRTSSSDTYFEYLILKMQKYFALASHIAPHRYRNFNSSSPIHILDYISKLRILFIRQVLKCKRMRDFLVNLPIARSRSLSSQSIRNSSSFSFVSLSEQEAKNYEEDIEENIKTKVGYEAFPVAWSVTCLKDLELLVSLLF